MIKHALLFVTVLIIISAQAQTNKHTENSKNSEIDKLYEKYKNTDEVTLYTPFGDIKGKVSMKKNDNDRAVSVNIYGESSNEDAVTEFLINTIKMKLKQGYKRSSTNDINNLIGSDIHKETFWEMVELSSASWTYGRKVLLKKGTMYFTVDAVRSSSPDSEFSSIRSTNCYWSIETGDSKRQGGSKASEFEF